MGIQATVTTIGGAIRLGKRGVSGNDKPMFLAWRLGIVIYFPLADCELAMPKVAAAISRARVRSRGMQARDFAIWTCPLNRSRLTVHQPLRVVDVKGGLSDAPAGAHSRAPLHHGCVGSARRPYFPSLMKSAQRSPIIMVVALVLARMQSGITDASATRRPSTPLTFRCWSTTVSGSLSGPILQVPEM